MKNVKKNVPINERKMYVYNFFKIILITFANITLYLYTLSIIFFTKTYFY